MNGRESIGSRFGFIMLAAGCAIGLGNVWRFPFIAGANGGALFVLLYIAFLLLLGLPVMLMELAVGRAARRGLYGAFRDLPQTRPSRWRFAGGVMLTGNLMLMIMYTTVTGWLLSYFCDFLTGKACNLNTPEALQGHFASLLASPGRMSVFMLLASAVGFVVGICGLRSGVERVTKILMSCLFILLLGLCVHALTLPGAKAGIRFYLMPKAENLTGGHFMSAVSGAMAQAFFTLSLGVGSMTIFGSYIGKKHTLASESLLIIGCDTLVALLSGVVIFAACFTYGITVDSGPSLLLISLTGVFNHLPGGRFWGAVFFLFLSIAALTTVIAVFENLVAFMIDERHMSRRRAAVINFATVSLLSFPCLWGFNVLKNVHPLGGGSTILDFEDWLVSDLYLPLGALTFVIFCCWRGWTWKMFLLEVNMGQGIRIPAWTKWYMKFVLPLLILALVVLGVYNRFRK